jgi:hypothetical protein
MSVEIPDRVKQALVGRERPEDRAALEAELAAARARGFKIPAIDTAQMVITAEQARVAIKRAGLDESSLFGKIMVTYRGFPPGNGSELYALDEVLACADGGFWDDEYPGFSQRFLQLSSIEGQGSYFYEIATGAVYDAGWEQMAALTSGTLRAAWVSYEAFLVWYYAPNA